MNSLERGLRCISSEFQKEQGMWQTGNIPEHDRWEISVTGERCQPSDLSSHIIPKWLKQRNPYTL